VVLFALGVFLASSAGMLLNIFFKISMHTIALGVVCTFFCMAAMMTDKSYGFYISAAFLAAGITSTARLIDSNHTPFEIYAGFITGVLVQLIAYPFV
jgi:hypothetical protein